MLARLPLLQQLSVKGAPLAAGATHQQELLVGGPGVQILLRQPSMHQPESTLGLWER